MKELICGDGKQRWTVGEKSVANSTRLQFQCRVPPTETTDTNNYAKKKKMDSGAAAVGNTKTG